MRSSNIKNDQGGEKGLKTVRFEQIFIVKKIFYPDCITVTQDYRRTNI